MLDRATFFRSRMQLWAGARGGLETEPDSGSVISPLVRSGTLPNTAWCWFLKKKTPTLFCPRLRGRFVQGPCVLDSTPQNPEDRKVGVLKCHFLQDLRTTIQTHWIVVRKSFKKCRLKTPTFPPSGFCGVENATMAPRDSFPFEFRRTPNGLRSTERSTKKKVRFNLLRMHCRP